MVQSEQHGGGGGGGAGRPKLTWKKLRRKTAVSGSSRQLTLAPRDQV